MKLRQSYLVFSAVSQCSELMFRQRSGNVRSADFLQQDKNKDLVLNNNNYYGFKDIKTD